MSTIVMRVDLDCEKCYKKIRKVLCKIQDKVSIRTITYDEKTKTVAISGPFDAEEVADRLTSSAGKVITDMHVAGGGNNNKQVFNAPKHGAKGDHGGFVGGGKQEKGHGGGGGGKHDKGHGGGYGGGGGGGNKQEKGHGHGGLFGGGNKQDKGHGHGGLFGGGNKQDKGHGHGHGGLFSFSGGKQDKSHGGHGGGGKLDNKKHVKFDFDDDMSDDDDFDDEPAHAHHGGHGGKPKIVTTNTPDAARLDAPRTGPAMSMAATAPMRMPGMMAPQPQMQMQMQPQALATPSIWPAPAAAPEWGYSAPQQYGGGYSNAGAGGYYGAPAAAANGHGGYGYYGGAPAAYGYYGRNPYAAPQQQYYDEEPSAGCSIM